MHKGCVSLFVWCVRVCPLASVRGGGVELIKFLYFVTRVFREGTDIQFIFCILFENTSGVIHDPNWE